MSTDVVASTTSLCPTCLESVAAAYERRVGAVYLTWECFGHGTATRQAWANADHWERLRETNDGIAGVPETDCADRTGCGYGPDGELDLTVDHGHSCVAIVEVT